MNIPKPITLLDTTIHPITLLQALECIDRAVQNHIRLTIFPMNVHILVELSKDKIFKKKHGKANIIFCDGVPLVWLSKLFKKSLPERVSGTDLVEALLRSEHRIFVLGSSHTILTALTSKYSDTKNKGGVCGTYSPSYKKNWDKNENSAILNKINKARPNILLVGVGPLKQEKWILNYASHTSATVVIAVGSAFDILSGKTPRAPRFMQLLAMEWAWRVLLEPKRLLKRYFNDALSFTQLVIKKI